MGFLLKIIAFPFKLIDDVLGWFVFDMLFHKKRGFVCLPLFVGAIGYIVYSWATIGPVVWNTVYDCRDGAYKVAGWEIPARSVASTGPTTETTSVAATKSTTNTATTTTTPFDDDLTPFDEPDKTPTATVTTPTPSPTKIALLTTPTPTVAPATASPTTQTPVTASPTPIMAPTQKPTAPLIQTTAPSTPTPTNDNKSPLPKYVNDSIDIVNDKWQKDLSSLTADERRLLIEGTVVALGYISPNADKPEKTLAKLHKHGGKTKELVEIAYALTHLRNHVDDIPKSVAIHAAPVEYRLPLVDKLILKNTEQTQLRALEIMLNTVPPTQPEAPYFPLTRPQTPPDQKFLPSLGKLARSAYSKVRERTALWLASLRSRSVIPFIKTLLKDPNGLVRIEAALALAAQGESGGMEVIKTALQDASPMVRARAIAALPQYSGAATKTNLQEWLIDGHPAVHLAAASTLLALDSPDGIWVIRDDLQDTDRRTKKIALGALANLPFGRVREAARTLLKTKGMPLETKLAVCRTIGSRGGRNSAGLAKALLKKKNESIRLAILEKLNDTITHQIKDEIHQIVINDKSAKVRLAAIKALQRLGKAAPINTLKESVEKEKNNDIRQLAIRALGATQDASMTTILTTIAQTAPDEKCRCEAYRAVSRLPRSHTEQFFKTQFGRLAKDSPERAWVAVGLLDYHSRDFNTLKRLQEIGDRHEL